MIRRIPERPAHPERICWGCDLYCAANDMRCGNGKERTQHPIETYGPDWKAFVLPGAVAAGVTPDASAESAHIGHE
jgi:hypothetical protein